MNQIFKNKFLKEKATWHDYLLAILIAIIASSIVYGLEHLTIENFSNISSFLILSVLISSILFGKGPSIVTAIICTFLYDWLMVPPFFGTVNSLDNLIKFSVFITAALLTSWVASMTKTLAIQLKHREQELMVVINEREKFKEEKEQEAIKHEIETLRNAILTSVSHDLKTPLASIIGAMSSMQLYGQTLSDEDKNKLNSSILSEANKLLGYVNNLLDVAGLENRCTMIKHETVAIDDLFDLTTKRMAKRLKDHNIIIDLEDESLAYTGDDQLLDIVLGNILDNAVKFSKPGSNIYLKANYQPQNDHVALHIEDEGCGVEKSEHEHVFDKFYRAKQSDKKNAGTGLGLWIAQQIIIAHNGKIHLSKRDNNKQGTIVSITLPAAKPIQLPKEKNMEQI